MGEALWDVLPEGKKIGGAPANFAYHVSQFGLRGFVVSAIGDDDLGREIMDTFDAKNLNYRLEVVSYPTGTVQVDVDGAGIPQYDIKEDVAWDHIPFDDALKAMAAETRVFCFGSLAQRSEESRATIRRYLDAMPDAAERLVVFDINLRQHYYGKDVLLDSMGRCNIFKINDEELDEVSRLFSLPEASVEDRCRLLLEKFNLKMLILTCGINGSYVFTPGNVSFQPTPKVEVADTVGAGDSFTAAFIASILKGKTVAEAHAKAVQVSAYVCTQKGAMPILPKSLTE